VEPAWRELDFASGRDLDRTRRPHLSDAFCRDRTLVQLGCLGLACLQRKQALGLAASVADDHIGGAILLHGDGGASMGVLDSHVPHCFLVRGSGNREGGPGKREGERHRADRP
jgi:hypothetical protein